VTVAAVNLWGSQIGAVSLAAGETVASFQYTPAFAASGVPIAPIAMPLQEAPYRFPGLSLESFHGLPGLLADSLPDRYGNALIDAWLARQGREPGSFDSVERLCYVGRRGMGALEYEPVLGPRQSTSSDLEIDVLVELASEVLTERTLVKGSFEPDEREHAIRELLLVGTSAGGARAKAVIAWNPDTNAVRSGQVDAGPGFQYWLLKFDGVRGNRDKELEDPRGFGAIEFAYYLMATAAGVSMPECRLMEENGRRHFMARRFDRTHEGEKLHMQSLAALAHFDFNLAGAYSYEQALQVCRRLALGMETVEQLFRRMAFNIVARNQDDHVKNIAFLMDQDGRWRLSPAFDVTYAFRPSGPWTGQHQMTLNGKRDEFARSDFRSAALGAAMRRGQADEILDEVIETVTRWQDFAASADVAPAEADRIALSHRLAFPAE
jgi:serine/threonine-protein kinase HipA